jgi:SMODS and SLOG-associating 2TM effector domain 3/SMODS and SLOG-associating 2TM effector domain 1
LRDPDDFPALYKSTDRTSLEAQNRFLTALQIRLGGLLLAAVGGAISLSLGSVQLGGVLALLAFLTALGAELYSSIARPDKAWYEGRAAAESVKTLTWRYIVRGEKFPDSNDPSTDSRFLAELGDVLQDLDALELVVDKEMAQQITKPMRLLRQQDFDARRRLYLDGRIRDQQGWYAHKAKWNASRSRRWLIVGIVAECLGVVGGALRGFAGVDVDLLGVFAAVAAVAAAWVSAKQHQTLSTAYGVTALELASVASEGDGVVEEREWARFVGQAEEAISREHTLWRASRGIRVRPRLP